jgi:hypothetical protein
MLDGLFYYCRGHESLDRRGGDLGRSHRRGDHHNLGRRRVKRLDDPKHCQVGRDNGDQGSNRIREDLLKFHLSCPAIEQSTMQTNPLHNDIAEDARVDALFRVIKGKINWDNLVPTLLEAAKELETMPDLKGSEKLDLLQKALKHAVKVSEKSTVEKEQILHTIETVVPTVMQGVMLASKSPIVGAVAAQVEAVCIGCWTKK